MRFLIRFPQSSERRGSRNRSLMRSAVHREPRSRSRMRLRIDRFRAPVGPGVTIGEDPARLLPPPATDVVVARPSSFSFSRDFAFRRGARPRAREYTYIMRTHILTRPTTFRSSGSWTVPYIIHRVSGGVWLSRYQGRSAIGHATLVKTEILWNRPKKETKQSHSFRWRHWLLPFQW